MAKIEVLLGTLILDKGRSLTVGEEATIDDKEAARLELAGIVRVVEDKKRRPEPPAG